MKIVTAHYEDGTKQEFECPDWAKWIEYSSSGGVFAWNKKPLEALWGSAFKIKQPNNASFFMVGVMDKNQLTGHTLTLHKIEVV